MARIVVHAVHANGKPRQWTLSERIVAENLNSERYATQLLERVRWAMADAEALESASADPEANRENEARRTPPRTGSSGTRATRRSGTRPRAGGRAVTT